MTQDSLGKYRTIALAALFLLLPLNGYIWSLPVTTPMLVTAGVLAALGVAALLLVNHFCSLADGEVSRLSGELEKKSAQVLELVEAEREDDRIIESLSERVNQLKTTIILNQSKHVSGEPAIVFPQPLTAQGGRAAALDITVLPDQPTVFSVRDFQLLATQFARAASRYDRHFTVLRIRMNIAKRSKVVGSEKANQEYQSALRVISKTLRISDFAAAEGSDSILIGYPETSAVHADAILSRLSAVLKASDAREIEIDLDRSEAAQEGSQS